MRCGADGAVSGRADGAPRGGRGLGLFERFGHLSHDTVLRSASGACDGASRCLPPVQDPKRCARLWRADELCTASGVEPRLRAMHRSTAAFAGGSLFAVVGAALSIFADPGFRSLGVGILIAGILVVVAQTVSLRLHRRHADADAESPAGARESTNANAGSDSDADPGRRDAPDRSAARRSPAHHAADDEVVDYTSEIPIQAEPGERAEPSDQRERDES